MPALIGLLWGGFVAILETLVGRVLVMLAVSYVTYQGVDLLLVNIKAAALASMGSMGVLSGVVGLLKLGECMNVVLSATVAKYTINGLTSGGITKMVFKK